MKKIFFITAILLFALSVKSQEVTCRYGFSYDISSNPHWGKDKLVITGIYPNSPAQRAGLKPFDIILAVNGKAITEEDLDDIYTFLNPKGKDIVELTIKNIGNEQQKVKVQKECRNSYELNEEQLATAFAMYAVEYNHERFFSCPYSTTQTKDDVDFAVFKSFDFVNKSDNQPEIAKKINDEIRKELIKRGLKYDPVSPDLKIIIYYSFSKNQNYKPKAKRSNGEEEQAKKNEMMFAYRYDIPRDKMTKFPFLSPNTNENEAEYILKLGFKLEDQKYEKGRIIWECEANELLNEKFSISDFAAVNIPLMCMQYPYVKYTRNVQYRLSKKKYNYTGINYSIDNISRIASVDPNSPAAKAGIKPYDKIDKIEDKRFDKSSAELSSAYRQFLINTLKLRNQETRFTDANGFPDCMEWDTFKYDKVLKEFQKKSNLTAFSYLFYFAPFINPTGSTSCSFKISRDKEKLEFILRPEVKYDIIVTVE